MLNKYDGCYETTKEFKMLCDIVGSMLDRVIQNAVLNSATIQAISRNLENLGMLTAK